MHGIPIKHGEFQAGCWTLDLSNNATQLVFNGIHDLYSYILRSCWGAQWSDQKNSQLNRMCLAKLLDVHAVLRTCKKANFRTAAWFHDKNALVVMNIQETLKEKEMMPLPMILHIYDVKHPYRFNKKNCVCNPTSGLSSLIFDHDGAWQSPTCQVLWFHVWASNQCSHCKICLIATFS